MNFEKLRDGKWLVALYLVIAVGIIYLWRVNTSPRLSDTELAYKIFGEDVLIIYKAPIPCAQIYTPSEYYCYQLSDLLKGVLPKQIEAVYDRNNSINLAALHQIGQLASLEQLAINEKRLISLPPEIGQLQNLKELDLNDNQLTSLPPEIGRLQHLEMLKLDSSQLTSLPPQISQLQHLIGLNLNNNQLTSLPPEISQLQHL
ncbi:MAG: leucine-rich repeat domain-containing protein, partial [Chloroflexota bacterium]